MGLAFSIIMIYTSIAVAKKLGYKGWEFLVPGYNIWVAVERITGKGANSLLLLLGLIPFVGIFIDLVLLIIWGVQFSKLIAQAYGAKAVWVFFISPFYLPFFVFRDAPYCSDEINKFVSKIFNLERAPQQTQAYGAQTYAAPAQPAPQAPAQ